MRSNDFLLPLLNPEVKRSNSQVNDQTYSLFQLEKIDLDSLSDLYSKRPRFNKAVKLMDKICSQSSSEDIDLMEFKFLIDAYNKQDAYATMLYIAHRLNESGLCSCIKVFKGSDSDLNDMGEYSIPGIHNMNNGIAAIDESEDDLDAPGPIWREEDMEAVFFISDNNEAGSIHFSALPSTSKLSEIVNPIVFLINIITDVKSIQGSNFSPFFNPKNIENLSLDYILHGFKHIEAGNFEDEEIVSLFIKYLSSRGYKHYFPGKVAEQAIIKFRKSLSYPIRELDIKGFCDAVINNHIMNRIDPSDKLITETSFNILTQSKNEPNTIQKVKVQNPWKELDKIVGMDDIKLEIRNLVNRLKLENRRRKMGLPGSSISLNAVFLGCPGTNKTSIARLLARILAYEKIIPSANFKECGKEDLVGEYVGWTAVKVKGLFDSISLNGTSGGVLFIDEAYSITDDQTSFDKEAINTLVQCMENYRNKVMVIFGGYKQKMLDFMGKNEGLRSRIPFVFEFKNYSNQELLDITKYQASLSGFRIEDGCDEEIINYFETLKHIRGGNFGNGREARTLYEFASLEMSTRLSQKKRLSKADLILITREDMKNSIDKALQRERVVSADSTAKRAIGFYK